MSNGFEDKSSRFFVGTNLRTPAMIFFNHVCRSHHHTILIEIRRQSMSRIFFSRVRPPESPARPDGSNRGQNRASRASEHSCVRSRSEAQTSFWSGSGKSPACDVVRPQLYTSNFQYEKDVRDRELALGALRGFVFIKCERGDIDQSGDTRVGPGAVTSVPLLE